MEFSDEALFEEFGILDPEPSERDVVLRAAAFMANAKWGEFTWAEDRILGAVEIAHEAFQAFEPQERRSGLSYRANYALGQAQGQQRGEAQGEKEESGIVGVFTDLVPSDVDEERFIDDLLGPSASYSPFSSPDVEDEGMEWDPAQSGVFYTNLGVLSVEAMVEHALEQVFDDVPTSSEALDQLREELVERLATWASAQDALVLFEEQDPEPETCPLSWVQRMRPCPKTGATVVTVNLERGMPHDGSVPPYRPDYVRPEYDVIREEWNQLKPREWQAWRRELELARARLEEAPEDLRLQAVVAELEKGVKVPEPDDADGCPGFWVEKVNPEAVWARNPDVVRNVAWAACQVAEQMGFVLNVEDAPPASVDHLDEMVLNEAVELLDGLGIGDVSFRQCLIELASQAARLSKSCGVEGVFDALYEHIEPLDWGADDSELQARYDVGEYVEPLLKAIQKDVLAGDAFPNVGVSVAKKVSGMHPFKANAFGDEVYEASVAAKGVVGQRAFAPVTEMLLAEKVSGNSLGFVPGDVLGIVGSVSVKEVGDALRSLDDSPTVVGGPRAAEIAQRHGVRFIEMPVVGNGHLGVRWAIEQTCVASTHVLAEKSSLTARLRYIGHELGIPVKFV